MVKSTKTSLKFANTEKRAQIASFIDEYQTVTQKFVDLIWNLERVPTFLDKEYTSQVETWLSARAVQCAGKQASGIVRGTRAKQEKRLFMINYFLEIGELKKQKSYKKFMMKLTYLVQY